jgi:SAM-dependent methyltransferase
MLLAMSACDPSAYRSHPRERARIDDLLRQLPRCGGSALDIGARDGHLSRLLTERFERVVALDLHRPEVDHPRVTPVPGDATRLEFPDSSFNVVICAEVLEHIPSPGLENACAEIARVAARAAVIGVPYRQDLRLGRTLCLACGRCNPPWGHVNAFDRRRLVALFAPMHVGALSYVGKTKERTNGLSASLMDFAGHPYGTYDQEEVCVYCGSALKGPPPRTLLQRLATRSAHWINLLQRAVTPARPIWLHARFEKVPAC